MVTEKTRIGRKVYFEFAEPCGHKDCSTCAPKNSGHVGGCIVRGASGIFVGLSAGGMAYCKIHGQGSAIETLPSAVTPIVKRRRK